jgi:hypothetical protein
MFVNCGICSSWDTVKRKETRGQVHTYYSRHTNNHMQRRGTGFKAIYLGRRWESVNQLAKPGFFSLQLKSIRYFSNFFFPLRNLFVTSLLKLLLLQ